MFNLKHYKPITAISLTITLSMAIASPLVKINPASAQLFPEQEYERDDIDYRDRDSRDIEYRDRDYRDRDSRDRRYSTVVIPAGAEIPLEYEKEKILVTKEETVPVTLIVAANIRDDDRNTLIPYGTEIEGEIQPARDGSRFVAQELVFADGTRQDINGSSDVVTRTEKVKRGTDTGDILKGAAIGGAAATVLSEVLGDINIEEVIGGAALGALGGWILGGNSVELISIDPNRDLDIVLESDLALR
ncbi:conserved exported hypothetical protein [Hyella patelloides LEGE 07179]|uniref:Glycine zipper domain-containing protein n=1 Tax=Hyella patelloides LEGE 07179 TaxID=945734 RepID=A0A563W240_9CYAN|nr:hypothetical protein [Hyella patelloides]VEP17736.1 conserved exported hypothetical protein [Hyella patelloides LEGE 07179]